MTMSVLTEASSATIAKSLIDAARYPIEAQGTEAYDKLIAICRAQLAESGACVLPGFINAPALRNLAEEATTLADVAYHSTVKGNAYLSDIDPSWADDDTRRLVDTTSLGVVAYDQTPADALLRKLYEWDALMEFIGAALGKEKLYRYADTMGAMNLAVMHKGDYLRWHFDQTDFVTTILLQSSQSGGDYEFVPMIRNAINENYGKVKSIINGSRDGVITLDIEPGSLVLFEGRNSLHRVTRIEGERMRLIALFGYDTKPGTQSSPYLRQIRYGRPK